MIKKAVIALGGNALIKKGQDGNIYDQFDNSREVAHSIAKIIKSGWQVAVTHGNGPHVGSILLQNNYARDITPPMPLAICVAESEGLIGYMIQQTLSNILWIHGIKKPVVTLITQVVVDQNDPSLENPTKPIGPYFQGDSVEDLKRDGYQLKEFRDGWRIVAPSPDPLDIVEGDIIKNLMDDDIVVIASGGGGMPVYYKENWGWNGIEAVVDKDLSSERLAESINADLLMILTNVDKVYLNYGEKDEKPIDKIGYGDLKKYYYEGHFPEGSMGPKVLSALRFIKSGGKKVIISHVEKGWEAFNGKTGTQITK